MGSWPWAASQSLQRLKGRLPKNPREADKGGAHKILPACDLPLTGLGVVDRIITDLGVLDVTEQGLKLVELAEGVSFEELQEATGCPIQR